MIYIGGLAYLGVLYHYLIFSLFGLDACLDAYPETLYVK